MNKFKILDELQHYKKIVAELETELQQIEEKDNASSTTQPVKKKLVIKFWKAEKALVMQILEQKGLPERKEKGTVHIINCPAMRGDKIWLRGNQYLDDFDVRHLYFAANSERDKYLDRITKAITDELFSNVTAELKIGEMCEVRSIGPYIDNWKSRRLVAVLPPSIPKRYICESLDLVEQFDGFEEARPIAKRTEPKVETNGEVVTYTWEEE